MKTMKENILDPYGDFLESRYYLEKFDLIPSQIILDIPLQESHENMTKVFSLVKQDQEIDVIIEKWNVSKHKDDKVTKDFINYYFIEVESKSVCMQIDLTNDDLLINYWYDHKNMASFKWVEESYMQIRNLVGSTASPTFKVLAKDGGDYYVEEITITSIKADIEMNYNEDFVEVDDIIQNSLQQERSGLILLHGKPGTGKTTYIKSLLCIHEEKNFIFIQNDFINELLQPDFISFLLTQKNSILVIEDAEKVISSREKVNKDSVVSTILQLTDGLFSDYLNIKIICTFNTNISNIDEALLRKGRMIAFYEFQELSIAKSNKLLASMDQEHQDLKMILADIYYLKSKKFYTEKSKIGFSNSL